MDQTSTGKPNQSNSRWRFGLGTLLICVAFVSGSLAIFRARSNSLVRIHQIHNELEIVLNAPEFKASFFKANPQCHEVIEDNFWVVFGPNGLRAKEKDLAIEEMEPITWSGEFSFEVGGPTCEIYFTVSRPWQLNLSDPRVKIEHLEGSPYQDLANYVEFALTEKFQLPDPTQIVMEE